MSDSAERIKAQYGNVSLESAPVNAENPGFDSLLSALEAVHTGKEDKSLLQKYYTALVAQNNESINHLKEILNDENIDKINIALTAMGMVGIMLDTIPDYIAEPTDEKMGITVSLLLNAMDKVEVAKAAI